VLRLRKEPAPTRAYAASGRRSWKARPSAPASSQPTIGHPKRSTSYVHRFSEVASRQRHATGVTANWSARPLVDRRSLRDCTERNGPYDTREGIKKSSHRDTILAVAGRQDQLRRSASESLESSLNLRAPEVNALVSTLLRPGRSGPGSRRPQSRRTPPHGEGCHRPQRCHPPSGGMRTLRQSRIARDVDFAAVQAPVMGDIRDLYGSRSYPKIVSAVRPEMTGPHLIFRAHPLVG